MYTYRNIYWHRIKILDSQRLSYPYLVLLLKGLLSTLSKYYGVFLNFVAQENGVIKGKV